MYTDVFKQIKETDLKLSDGNYLKAFADVALMTSAIELVGSKLKFLSELNYESRNDADT
jgi:hypothetical protein